MSSQYGWAIERSVDFNNVTASLRNCTDGVQWIWWAFHDCVDDWRGQLSTYLGLLSMVIWMIVGIPQMVKNCRNINGMAGVSFFLLAQWFAGDVTNLVGSILTKQLEIQIYVAIYYVSADIVLLIQYLVYIRHKRKLTKSTPNNPGNFVQPILCITGLFMFGSMSMLNKMLPLSNIDLANENDPLLTAVHHRTGRNLLSTNVGMKIFFNSIDETGYAIGVVSSVFYIGSRLAQIIRNAKLKSTEGLSKIMFVLAIFGNLFYGLAIIIHTLTGVYMIRHMPWIIGSLGVIFLDFFILGQFYYYEQRNFDSLSRAPLIIDQAINDGQT